MTNEENCDHNIEKQRAQSPTEFVTYKCTKCGMKSVTDPRK